MKSSYLNSLDYGDIISSITFLKKPKMIVEFGILDGFSLSKFIEHAPLECNIMAFDIFDEFNGNHADYDDITTKFENYENLIIKQTDIQNKLCINKMKSFKVLSVLLLFTIITEIMSQNIKCDINLGCLMRVKYFAHVSVQTKTGKAAPLKSSLNYICFFNFVSLSSNSF